MSRPGVVRVQALAERLPSVRPGVAHGSRTLFDRRLAAWLLTLLRLTPVRAGMGRAPADALVLSMACGESKLGLAIDASAWPALKMAADLPDRELARDVARALVMPWVLAFAPSLPGIKLHGLGRIAVPKGEYPVLECGPATLTLLHLDRALADRLDAVLGQHTAVQAHHLRRLTLPLRLQLFRRELRHADLGSLGPGDIVLADAACQVDTSFQATVVFGSGITMQASAKIDPHASRMNLAERARQVDEHSAPAQRGPGPGRIGELLVPVAFEIDATRMSLDELAAMGEGAVIELDMPLMEASVRLVCHGQTVGHGQLVAIGERLGVRIISMGAAAGFEAPASTPRGWS